MVQEVIHLEAELQPLRLRDREILEQAQIGVEVMRPIDDRQQRRTILANRVWGCETAAVDVLVRPQARQRIASHDRVKLFGVGAQNGLIVDLNTSRVSCTDRPGIIALLSCMLKLSFGLL